MIGDRPGVALANQKRARSVRDRIWDHVGNRGSLHPVHGRCWTWSGSVSSKSSGRYAQLHDGVRMVNASVVMLRDVVGKRIPKQYCVCHHCDNPQCVNPDHLFIGTHKDNNDDKERKGRGNHPAGEHNARAKLTAKRVRYARRVFIKGHRRLGTAALARMFGVSEFAMAAAISGRLWKSVR